MSKKKSIRLFSVAFLSFTAVIAGALVGAVKLLSEDSAAAAEPDGPALVIWAVSGDPLTEALKSKAEQFSSTVAEREDYIIVAEFGSEDELAAAMDIDMPDMFVAPYSRMRVLCQSEKLKKLTAYFMEPVYKTALAELDGNIGKTIFPLGMETNVLICRKGLYDEVPGSLSGLFRDAQLYGAENSAPYIYVEDFSSLFNRAVREKGGYFSSDAADGSEAYNSVYNYIGGAGYSYGVLWGDFSPLDAISEGSVQCAICSSRYLDGISIADFDVYNVPQAGETAYVSGDMACIAITPEANGTMASEFISWLSDPERLESLAVEGCRVPVITVEGESSTTIESVLKGIADTSLYYIPSSSSSYEEGRAAFNRDIAEALEDLKR